MRALKNFSTREKIIVAWFAVGVVFSAVSTLISIVFWHYTYVPEPNIDWRPMHAFSGVFVLMPLGWVISIATPAGWLSIAGMAVALYKISYKPLLLSAAGSIIFGLYWPRFIVGLSGV